MRNDLFGAAARIYNSKVVPRAASRSKRRDFKAQTGKMETLNDEPVQTSCKVDARSIPLYRAQRDPSGAITKGHGVSLVPLAYIGLVSLACAPCSYVRGYRGVMSRQRSARPPFATVHLDPAPLRPKAIRSAVKAD